MDQGTEGVFGGGGKQHLHTSASDTWQGTLLQESKAKHSNGCQGCAAKERGTKGAAQCNQTSLKNAKGIAVGLC